MTERERPYQITDALIPLASLAATYFIVTGAFSRESRKKIWQRDKGQSVLSGHQDNLECAHLNHSRDYNRYDDPSNGRLLTIQEHYLDHYNRHGNRNLGLTKRQNAWSLNAIWNRMSPEERAGLPAPRRSR